MSPLTVPSPSNHRSLHRRGTWALGLLVLAGCGAGEGATGSSSALETPPAPVEVAAIERGAITLRRTFSGTLEPSTLVQVAARVGGRLARVAVDIGDEVQLGDVIAEIDAAELDSQLLSAEADLAVAQASVVEAEAASNFSARALERLEVLDKDGVASKSELDSARAQASARAASVAVAEARVQRAEAALRISSLQRAEADVLATWSQPPPDADQLESLTTRAVAQRYVDEGELVSAGMPLVQLVGLQPIVAVVFVPERDYARLVPGATAQLVTDAYPDEIFHGRVTRVAPIFSRNTRQVRVELRVHNDSLRLKPGMFIRATLELASVPSTLMVPYETLTKRDGSTGLFVLDGAARGGASSPVRWVPVKTGIREGDRMEVSSLPGGSPLREGAEVVLLGHELCDDGSLVIVPAGASPPSTR